MAVALAGGYLLGRSRKTRLAAVLALLAAGGRIPVDPGELLRRAAPGAGGEAVGQVTDQVGARLTDAGRSAVMAAASGGIDALSDSLHRRAERLRNPQSAASDGGASDGGGPDADPSETAEQAREPERGREERTATRRSESRTAPPKAHAGR